MSDTAREVLLQNVGGVVQRLRQFPPFDQMNQDDLVFIAEHARLGFYAAGDQILTPADGQVERLYIIKQGQVRGERPTASGEQESVFLLTSGECFPKAALLGERPTRTVHRAVTDTFCYEIDRDSFATVFARSAPFRDFFLRGVSNLLEQLSRQTQAGAAENLGAQALLNAPLSQVLTRTPVTCRPDTPIREAVQAMHTQKVGSIVVCDEQQRPRGIFTLHDLLAVMARGETDIERPISAVMTPRPMGLPASAFAFDAAVLMAKQRFGHVCVLADERLVGVVSERDLFALQRVDLVHLSRFIARAESIDVLQSQRRQIHRLIDAMLAHGAGAAQITRIITLLNDQTVSRVLELCLAEHGDPGVEFTWLAFGSEGRREQTLSTDQDNGIYFQPRPGISPEEARRRLLPFARRVNEALAQVGFPLCRGNVMASNPELCLSDQEWRQRFARIIDAATPENLLKSSIYFDLRPVWGPGEDAEAMYRDVIEHASGNSIFLRLLAANGLRTRPPLGLIRDFVVSRDESNQETLDLKVEGLTPFVDSARVLALAHRVSATGTQERLQTLAERGHLERRDAAGWIQAHGMIQLIRMRNHQQQAHQGTGLSNRIDPEQLNQLDRRSLKEAFREARRIQRRLELDYQL